MVDEDFVLGYAVGFNDGVGSGGGWGGIVIKDGATVYDVPILHNYSIVGTDYGLATFDVNECAFLNLTPTNASYIDIEDNKNPITGEMEVYKRSQPSGGTSRSIAYALTKGGKAIGIYKAQSASFTPYVLGEPFTRIEDGTLYPRKERHAFTTIRNPILTFEDVPVSYDPTQTNLNMYLEYDAETRTITYTQPKTYYNEEYLFKYYRKAELDAQTIESDQTTTTHRKIKITNFGRILSAEDYPEEWLNKYRFTATLQNPVFGISIMDNFELTTTYFSGIQ